MRLRRGAIVVAGLAVNAPGRLSVKIRARRLLARGTRTVSAGRWAVRGAAIERTTKVIVRR